MALSEAIADQLCNLVVDSVDVGTGTSQARFTNADQTVIYLAFNLDNNAFGDASSTVANVNNTPKAATGLATGTATHYQVVNRNGVEIDSRALASPISVTLNESYTMNSGTYTQPRQ